MNLRKIKVKKKGSVVDILIWMVVSFVIVMFFAVWVYGFNTLTTTLQSVTTPPGGINFNFSGAVNSTFGQINPAQTTGLHTLAYMMIFAMALSILITNFLEKAHPAFFVVYLLVVVGAIIGAVIISNTYENLMVDPLLGTTISDFKGGSFILLHLPTWVTLMGIGGAIFLFAGIMRDRGLGEGI